MSDKQTTALTLFLFLAFVLYLNNTPSVNRAGTSKLAEIIDVIKSGFSGGAQGLGTGGGAGASKPGGSGAIGKALDSLLGGTTSPVSGGDPPLWPTPKTFPDLKLPDGYYSPAYITDLQAYIEQYRRNPGSVK